MQEHLPDRDLVGLMQNPETSSYGFYQFIQKYQKVLYKQVFRLLLDNGDTEDVIQDVFVKAFEYKAKLHEINRLPSWLMTIAIHQALMLLRKRKMQSLFRIHQFRSRLEQGIATHFPMGEEEIEKRFLKAQLTLTNRQRAVFNLRYYDEMKFSDIAEVLGITEGACKATYHNAARRIENTLTE